MQCPNCSNVVPDVANVCGYCGTRLRHPVPTEPPPPAPQPVPPPQPVASYPPAPQKTSMRIPGRILGLIGGMLLMTMVSIVVWFNLPKLQDTVPTAPVVNQPTAPVAPIVNQPTAAATKITNQPTATSAIASDDMPRSLEQKLINPREIMRETFDEWSGENWGYSEGVKTTNGSDQWLEIPGVTVWAASLAAPTFQQGQGAYISFKLANPPNGVEFFATQGAWDTSSYKRFGGALYEQGNLTSTIFKGSDASLSGQDLNRALEFKPGDWYAVFIGMDKNAMFRLLAWDWEGSREVVSLDYQGPFDWKTGQWEFVIQVDNGTLFVNDFVLVEFDGFK